MTEHRPPEVRPEPLQPVAVEYHRWSTDPQVQKHGGSTGHQRKQVEHAQHMAWAEGAIVAIEDVGVGGATADRPAFQRLLEMVNGAKSARSSSVMSHACRDPSGTWSCSWRCVAPRT